MYSLKTEYHFDSAHFLTDYYGKCENLHGHQWRVMVYISQESLNLTGTHKDMVIDFGVFKKAVREVCDSMDHTFLVEEGSLKDSTIEALKDEGFTLFIVPWRTTAENIATYIAEELISQGFAISAVEVYETPNNCAIYEPLD